MEDIGIIELFWSRNDEAILETERKYGRLCRSIAGRVLGSEEDAEECVNDAFLHAWNSIPPERPNVLSAFLSKIVRNLALDRYRYNHAQKRFGEVDALYSEMDECIPDRVSTEQHVEAELLTDSINRFLAELPDRKRIAFVRRYWYACSLKETADMAGTTEAQMKSMLFRIRKDLKDHLEKEGFNV